MRGRLTPAHAAGLLLIILGKPEQEGLSNGALYILLHMIPHPCVAAGIQDHFTAVEPIHVPVLQTV